jgi:hypothetical protein
MVAGLLRWYGAPIRDFIEARLTLVTTGFAALIRAGLPLDPLSLSRGAGLLPQRREARSGGQAPDPPQGFRLVRWPGLGQPSAVP